MADDFSQIAKDFIDRANGGTGPTGTWRLEVLQKRFSSNANREIPIRIRRFLKGIPWAQVHDAIRYLISQSPYTGIIYNGVELKGTYRPTLTQWRRDDQEQVGGNAQGSYTLIQDLIEVTDGDKLDTVSADSCSETEMTKWVWDAPEIEKLPELPYDGSQGVTYAIRQVRRNEDGTFDYAIVRQVAKTKISGWIVTECDKYSRVSVKVFDNVYGGLSDGDPFTDGTTVLPIPAPCETNVGTLVQVSVAQNPDCTFRVTVQKTEAKPNVEKTSETRKGLRGVVTSETTVATNPLPETGLDLGEQVRNERRPDGLYDVTHVKVSKESVGDIGSACERTVFEHQHAETRNEAVRPEDEAGSAGGGKTYQVQSRATEEGTWDVTRTETTEIAQTGAQKTKQKTLRGVTETTVDRNVDNDDVTVTNIGDRVSVEMTPGGKYNRTVTKVSKESVGDVGSNCEKTVFQHTHVESENVATRPAKEASSAGGGKTYQVQARATEEGTWDVSRTTVEEAKDVTAQHVMRKTLRGVTETTVTRSTSNSSVSVSEIGDEVRVEQTPGGLWNRTETHASHEAVGVIGKSCSSTPVVHTDTVLSNVPDGFQPEPRHQIPEVNVEKTVETRRTEEGTWDVTERTTKHQKDTQTLRAGNSSTTVDLEIGKNVPSVDSSRGGVNQDVSISASRNDHGSFDYQKRTVTYESDTQTLRAGNSSTTVDLEIGKNVPSVGSSRGGVNQDVSISASRNDHGSFDYQKRTVTYESDTQTLRAGNSSTTVDLEIGKNVPSVGSSRGGVNQDVSISASRNDHGSFDYQKRTVTYESDRVNLLSGNMATSVDLEIGKNQPSVPGERGGMNRDVSISASKNDHGSYDYQKRTIVYTKASTVSQSSWATEKIRTTRSVNDTNLNPSASVGTASASPNDHGSATTEVSEYKPIPKDSDWIKWDSTTKLENGYAKFKHAVRIFVNLATPPTPPSGSNCNLDIHINKFGLYDGKISYSDLVEWNKSGDGGVSGGIQSGHVSIYQYKHDALGKSWRRLITVPTITYYGSGNEGSEANTKSSQIITAGIVLGSRTYATGAPNEGAWQASD